jgi:regulator of sigma E protease
MVQRTHDRPDDKGANVPGKARDPLPIDGNWPHAFWNLQDGALAPEVVLKVRRKDAATDAAPTEFKLAAAPDPTWPLHHRGLLLDDETRVRKTADTAAALRQGADRTARSGRHLYAILRQLATGNISAAAISGPITIFQIIYNLTNKPLGDLFVLLAFININLAVINFLPIFVLDGGHMVLLLYEAVFRRRPTEKVLFALNILGFVLIGSLMLFAISQDVRRLVLEWLAS